MQNSRKFISGIVGAILLGVAGSALWDLAIKPAYYGSVDLLFNVTTLGINKIQNLLFLEIAKGLHENTALAIYSIIFAAFTAIPLTLLVLIVFFKKYWEMSQNLTQKIIEKKELPKKRLLKFITCFFLVFVITISFFESFKVAYINKSVTYYYQLLRAVAPYVEESEYKLIESSFAQIKNRKDYEKIVNQLEQSAKKNNVPLKIYKQNFQI